MTPNFALDLSEDGITLLHRAPNGAGWFREGRVDFSKDNIAEGLARLRARAIELEGEGFQTKLLLPRSQLLFTHVDKGADVGQALSERTPYREDQLSYDVSEADDHLKVVAVALETLGEAEGFITPHRLNPVGFTAIPDEGQFDGEPMLSGMLMGPDSFQTDDQPVRVIENPTFLPAPVEPVEAEPPVQAKAAPAEDVTPLAEEEAESTKDTPAVEAATAAAPPAENSAAEPVVATPPTPKRAPPVSAPVEPRAGQPAAFSSRRNGDDSPPEKNNTGERVKRRAPRIVTRILDFDPAPTVSATKAEPPAPAPIPEAPKKAAAQKTQKPQKKAKTKAEKPTAKVAPPPKRAVAAPTAPKPVPVVPPSSIVTANSRDGSQPPAAVAARMAKADPLAHLAAKQQRGKPRFLGLILTCILLVCLGLAALLSSFVLPESAVGRLFSGDNDEQTDLAQGTAVTDPELIEGPEADLPLIDETPFGEGLPFDKDLEIASLPTEEDIPDFARINEDDLPPLAVPDETVANRPEVITEDEALAAYAATGIWQYANTLKLGQSSAETLDTLYVASLDPSIAFEDAPVLLPPADGGGEVALAAFTPPPPPGVIFDFDERGLVRPTPEGAINPFGIVIYDGSPPLRAVPRPTGEEPVAPVRVAPEARPELEVADAPLEQDLAPEVEQAPEADPETLRLAGIRPAQRPGNLIETRERATLGGLTRAELAQFRPRVRPTSEQAQAEAIARALAEADADNPQADLRTATAQAVSQSVRAPSRPRSFELVVARARQATPQTNSASTAGIQRASAARAAPEPRGNGPAVALSSRVRPTGPVSSRVARAATDNNAIALGRVSLVGVFGTSSNRSALVRMPNGRFKKVSVGDRVDGGRVAAISSSSLRYTKSGRTVTLDMPSS